MDLVTPQLVCSSGSWCFFGDPGKNDGRRRVDHLQARHTGQLDTVTYVTAVLSLTSLGIDLTWKQNGSVLLIPILFVDDPLHFFVSSPLTSKVAHFCAFNI